MIERKDIVEYANSDHNDAGQINRQGGERENSMGNDHNQSVNHPGKAHQKDYRENIRYRTGTKQNMVSKHPDASDSVENIAQTIDIAEGEGERID